MNNFNDITGYLATKQNLVGVNSIKIFKKKKSNTNNTLIILGEQHDISGYLPSKKDLNIENLSEDLCKILDKINKLKKKNPKKYNYINESRIDFLIEGNNELYGKFFKISYFGDIHKTFKFNKDFKHPYFNHHNIDLREKEKQFDFDSLLYYSSYWLDELIKFLRSPRYNLSSSLEENDLEVIFLNFKRSLKPELQQNIKKILEAYYSFNEIKKLISNTKDYKLENLDSELTKKIQKEVNKISDTNIIKEAFRYDEDYYKLIDSEFKKIRYFLGKKFICYFMELDSDEQINLFTLLKQIFNLAKNKFNEVNIKLFIDLLVDIKDFYDLVSYFFTIVNSYYLDIYSYLKIHSIQNEDLDKNKIIIFYGGDYHANNISVLLENTDLYNLVYEDINFEKNNKYVSLENIKK